jgi:hypothetical protein
MHVDTRPLLQWNFRSLWLGQMSSTLGGAIGTVAVVPPLRRKAPCR